jgi:hypothetical protein
MITRIWDEAIARFRYVEAVNFTGPRAEYRLAGTKQDPPLSRIDDVRRPPPAIVAPVLERRIRPTFPCACGGRIPEREWVRRHRRCEDCRAKWPTTGRRKPRGGPVAPPLPFEMIA